VESEELDLVADAGQLVVRLGGADVVRLVFYRKDYVLVRLPDGGESHSRANFVRGPDGTVAWFRFGGRLYRHGGAPAALRAGGRRRPPVPVTLPHPTV